MDKAYPFCAEKIEKEAIKCRYYQSYLIGFAESVPTSPSLVHVSRPAAEHQFDDAALKYDAQKKNAGIAYFL